MALDLDSQKKIAEEIQQIAWDEGFYFNGGEYRSVSAWRSNVQGTNEGPLSLFWNIRK
ncbi:hypothetical protein D3C78_1926700 [compost metagenome]